MIKIFAFPKDKQKNFETPCFGLFLQLDANV